MKNLTILPLILLSLTISGCAVTSAGVKKGDERNFVRSINDVNARRVIKSRLKRTYDFNLKSVDVDVREGIVVLTGNVPSQKDRIEAERIAWSAQSIDQIGNEILVKDHQSNTRKIKDELLERSVHTRLTADKYVKARNINVETHDGKVFLLGVARNQAELERAAQIASTTRGAREASAPVPSSLTPSPSFAQPNFPQAVPTQQRNLPSFLTTAPQGGLSAALPNPSIPSPLAVSPGISAPSGTITSAPLSAPIPFIAEGPTAPRDIDMGDRLNKEFPTDEELGKFRTGAAGEAVSIIESEPYYIDPKTGKEIPVSFLRRFKK